MKTVKRIFAVAASLALVCVMSMMPVTSAHAADKVTFYATYSDTLNKWVYSSSVNALFTEGSDYIDANMKDGDNLIIDAKGYEPGMLTLKVHKKIGELAVANKAFVHVEAPDVDIAYVAGEGIMVLYAPHVGKVDVYPKHVVQIEGNVDELTANYVWESTDYPRFAVTGTVGAAKVNYTGDISSAKHWIYGIPAGKMTSNEKGVVALKEGQYSKAPVADPGNGTTGGNNNNNSGNKGVLDDVPKTGAAGLPESFLFFGLSAVFACGAVFLKKKLQ